MIKRTGLTEEQSANSFSDEDLVGMVCGNNPQANAYRELLASRQSLLDCKQRIQQLLAERNSTGLAIDKAILSGIVPEQHPLRSRLELLANHHKREQALAELLRRARRYVSPLSCPESEIQIVQSIVSSIDSVLAGKINFDLLMAAVHKIAPEGWQLVPVEPTENMIGHGCGASVMVVSEVIKAWAAMLAAAPKPEAK